MIFLTEDGKPTHPQHGDRLVFFAHERMLHVNIRRGAGWLLFGNVPGYPETITLQWLTFLEVLNVAGITVLANLIASFGKLEARQCPDSPLEFDIVSETQPRKENCDD